MNGKSKNQFLKAAYEVLSRAHRPMHYTQIASVGRHLGVLQSYSASIEIAMSSMLSSDIRTNPDSRFARERPGVYTLSPKGLVGSASAGLLGPSLSSYVDHLQVRAGLSNLTLTVNRALYLTRRTIDIAGPKGVLLYISTDRTQSIEINTRDLLSEFASKCDTYETVLFNAGSQAIVMRAKRLADHFGVEDLSIVVRISLFLLELAIDLVGTEHVLLMQSETSSAKIPVRTGKHHVST